MSVYNKIMHIQKLNLDTEVWEDYYYAHTFINKASGKEYFNARTEITSNTFNFYVRYSPTLEDVMYNTEIYRVVYKDKCFDIKNIDNYMLKNHELIIVGEFNGKYIDW